MPEYSFNDYLRILEPLYSKEDPAHGPGHMRRLHSKALAFAKGQKCNSRLIGLGAALHGAVSNMRAESEQLLLMAGVPASLLEKGVAAALESQAEAVPETIEGKILHDAHLCEGGEDFIAAKAIAAGGFRGNSIAETYAWVTDKIIRNRKRRCYTAAGRKEYARKLVRLRKIWAELGSILGAG